MVEKSPSSERHKSTKIVSSFNWGLEGRMERKALGDVGYGWGDGDLLMGCLNPTISGIHPVPIVKKKTNRVRFYIYFNNMSKIILASIALVAAASATSTREQGTKTCKMCTTRHTASS